MRFYRDNAVRIHRVTIGLSAVFKNSTTFWSYFEVKRHFLFGDAPFFVDVIFCDYSRQAVVWFRVSSPRYSVLFRPKAEQSRVERFFEEHVVVAGTFVHDFLRHQVNLVIGQKRVEKSLEENMPPAHHQ